MDETGVRNLTFLDKQVSRLRNKKSVLLRSLTNHWAPVNLENTATLYRFLHARWVSALSALCRREILVSHGCPEAWKRNRNTFHRRKHIYDDIYMLIRKYANVCTIRYICTYVHSFIRTMWILDGLYCVSELTADEVEWKICFQFWRQLVW